MDISIFKGLDYKLKKEEQREQIKLHAKFITDGPKSMDYSEIKNLALWGIYRSPLLDAKPGTKDYKLLKKLIAIDNKAKGKPYRKSDYYYDNEAEERFFESLAYKSYVQAN